MITYTPNIPPLQEQIRAKIFTTEINPTTEKPHNIVLYIERRIADDSYMISADVGKTDESGEPIPNIIGHNPEIMIGHVDNYLMSVIACENPHEVFYALQGLDNDVKAFTTTTGTRVVCCRDCLIMESADGNIQKDIIVMHPNVYMFILGMVTFDDLYKKYSM